METKTRYAPLFALLSAALAAVLYGCAAAPHAGSGAVIEIATFQLEPGVTEDEFRSVDRAVELEHVARQPGFLARESAAGDDGRWLVIVHWRSVEDADASMASFGSAPATAEFLARIQTDTMEMTRYRSK
ncbi:MAG: antibiotic biosynthesis monooxygenase [Planctomycetota bacterium]